LSFPESGCQLHPGKRKGTGVVGGILARGEKRGTKEKIDRWGVSKDGVCPG